MRNISIKNCVLLSTGSLRLKQTKFWSRKFYVVIKLLHQVNAHLKLIFLIPICALYSYCPFSYLCFASKSNNVMNKYLCMKEPLKSCSGNNKLAVSSWFVPCLFENTFSSSYVYNYISRLYNYIITTTMQRITCKKYQKTEFNRKQFFTLLDYQPQIFKNPEKLFL